ncbi:type IVB secretion system protein IcmH/DotU [Nitratireductor sp. GCM10026969]|uniref:type IVB secretion system protein IcmH/DotU n=1 Tax=Nitratireductor sp. GCM10026969 TaxID=3252645 RepID=UPI00360E54D3
MDFGEADAGRGSNAAFPDAASSQTAGFGFDDDFFDGRRMRTEDNAVSDFGPDEGLGESLRRGGDRSIDKAFELAAVNPLVSAASPLLWLAGRLNESAPPDDIAEFRRRVIEEIKHFESAAMARDIPSRLVRVSRYAICAAIDDIILNTRWGGASGWASSSLVGALYNETWGGERFYDLLSQLLRQPEQNIDALELMAICMAIGFVGKYRVMEGGQSHLTRLRHELYRTIRRVRGPYERSLSGAWQTEAAPYKPPRAMTGPWLAALILLILLLGLWAFSSISLRGGVEQAAERIRALAPTIPIVVERAGVPQIPDPVPPVRQTQLERLSEFLAADIAAGRLEVVDAGDNVLLRMLDAAFPSGGRELSPEEEPLVERIAEALDSERGPILVIGHTDNVPVGAGSPLGDNMAISQARAESAAEMLRRYIDTPSRVRSEGRGENDPIASNGTAEGRARNRRVEFQIPAEDVP